MQQIKYFIFLFVVLCHISLKGQVNMIKYENKLLVDESEMLDVLSESQDSLLVEDTSFFDPKELVSEMVNRSNDYTSTYYFNDTIVRFISSDTVGDNAVYFIDPISSQWTRYYTDRNGVIKFTEIKINPSSDWKLSYSIEIDKSIIKNILGYECYKVVIVETRESISKGWTEGCTYECYVTDELNLPFNCTELILERVLDKTPLELIYYNHAIPSAKEWKRAIEIDFNVNVEVLRLPEVFQDAIKAN